MWHSVKKKTEVSKSVCSKTEIAHQKVSVALIACFELRKVIGEVEKSYKRHQPIVFKLGQEEHGLHID